MDWSEQEIAALYGMPFLDLVFQAAAVHRRHHDPHTVQLCTLQSIKTGGCPEDCGYCSQSTKYETPVENEKLMQVDTVLAAAREAKEAGSTRFCMGAAWRNVNDGRAFDRVLDMVRGVRALGLEACCTLGMVSEDQARRLADAGLTAYNHNLDTSEEYYPNVISTRTYQDRLQTIENVSKAGISVCCGGILGLGESHADRVKLLHTLCSLRPQPESVPINVLVPVEGTPLAANTRVDALEWVRAIAVARILMPKAKVRLSAGRLETSAEAQALAFLAGANSIFTGDRLLTTPNPEADIDRAMLDRLGLRAEEPMSAAHLANRDHAAPATAPGTDREIAPAALA